MSLGKERGNIHDDAVFNGLAEDIADWGERFRRLRDNNGREAAEQMLGGITEWLGGDLVDGMPAMPLASWTRLDELAEELLQCCKACLCNQPGADDRLLTIIAGARGMKTGC